MRVAFITHGCRLNRADSDAMAGALRSGGHEVVPDPAGADAIVLNSCTITHEADADARRVIRRLRREHPEARLVATGCWATARPELARELGCDVVLDNAGKPEVVHALGGDTSGRDFVAVDALVRRTAVGLPAAVSTERARAQLKVQDGCNYRCAFCIVPRVRGASRSLDLDEAGRQLEALVADGAPEVVVTGVHLGTWGRDLRPRRTVPELVDHLVARLGTARLRLSSLDPHEVDDELLRRFEAYPGRLCRHLHLPVQSVDDEVLRAMRRGHGAAEFSDIVRRATARVPGLAVGTDVIAGFPSETEAAFARTAARLGELPLAYLHVFSYSRRDGTTALDLPDVVGAAARAARTRRLRALSDRMQAAFRRSQAGAHLDVVTHRRRDRDGATIGITDNFLRVRVEGDDVPGGGRVEVVLDATGQRARRRGS